jgi:DNA modification methylase
MMPMVMEQTLTEHYASYNGDSVELLRGIPDNSIHLTTSSPPFSTLYAYSPSPRDIGNCKSNVEFQEHFFFIVQELFRITMPGRIAAIHIADVPAMLVRDGWIGLKDVSGDVIALFVQAGWIFDARIPLDKNQQAASIRTHSKALTMSQMHKDRSWLRPALPDYILKFRKPGDNPIPVVGGMTGDEWIDLANPTWPNEYDRATEWGAWSTWYGIRESDTLNTYVAKEERDERHIAPLQLGTIERCVRLWSNPGETILDPFSGIASTGVRSIELGRKYIGCELKTGWYSVGVNNLNTAVESLTPKQANMFGGEQC